VSDRNFDDIVLPKYILPSDLFKILIACVDKPNNNSSINTQHRRKKITDRVLTPADFPASIYHEYQWRESLIGNLLLEELKTDEEAGIQRYFPGQKVRLAVPVGTNLNLQYRREKVRD